MKRESENILLTNHSKIKMETRSISIEMIKTTLSKPDLIEDDKFDVSIKHFIKEIENKYLRVIVRHEGKSIVIITTFFDRRIKEKKQKGDLE
ncbi:MAG: DUF4258 domain-containing protein [Melioribacteraceae bacterium]|nr:DUF4258 domain-containing protein [Bacteroidales bacterium]MCF6270617.1 DUF4258 domain-containing protein [Melioribacteraceae bacterium]